MTSVYLGPIYSRKWVTKRTAILADAGSSQLVNLNVCDGYVPWKTQACILNFLFNADPQRVEALVQGQRNNATHFCPVKPFT